MESAYSGGRKVSKRQLMCVELLILFGIGCRVFVINLLWCMKAGSLSYVLARNSHEKIFQNFFSSILLRNFQTYAKVECIANKLCPLSRFYR